MIDGSEKRGLMEGYFKENKVYENYHELCMKLDTVPVSREKLVDMYLDIIDRCEQLYEEASSELESDKKQLLESLESEEAPVEDIVTVDDLPPSTTVTVNELKTGVICLYVVFPKNPSQPYVIPAHVDSESGEATFL